MHSKALSEIYSILSNISNICNNVNKNINSSQKNCFIEKLVVIMEQDRGVVHRGEANGWNTHLLGICKKCSGIEDQMSDKCVVITLMGL